MMRQSALVGRLTLVTVMSLLMSACGAGGGGGAGVILPLCAPSAPTGVVGCVTNSRGGPAVQGATIAASGTTMSATTNTQGAYTLTLNPGTYDILASKSGMAASKFQGVIVSANQTAAANLIMFSVFDPTKPIQAPTISVSGLNQGQAVSGTITFIVNVTPAGTPPNPIRRIDVRTSNMQALAQSEVTDSNSGTFTLNSTALANGPAFVDIITYDLNQNSTETIIGFTVNNTVSGTPPGTPTGLALEAVTTGQSLGLFSTQRAQLFTKLGIKQDPRILNVGGHSINLLAAPSNATLFVKVGWNTVTGAVGYKVFRSFGASGPFTQIAQLSSTLYNDPDPSLAPGVTVYYEVSAFSAGGESAPSTALAVTPLQAFNLNLTSPVNASTNVSTSPTFTWTPIALVGTDQFYDIVVWGLNDPNAAWMTGGFTIIDRTSITFGAPQPLFLQKVYQWDIYEAAAQTVYSFSPLSFAVAVASVPNSAGLVPTSQAGGSLNGPFTFTTVP